MHKPPLTLCPCPLDCVTGYIFIIPNGTVDGLQNRFDAASKKRGTTDKEGMLCQRRNINTPHSFAQQKRPRLLSFFVRHIISVLRYWTMFIGLYVLCLWKGGNANVQPLAMHAIMKNQHKHPFHVCKHYKSGTKRIRRPMHPFACQKITAEKGSRTSNSSFGLEHTSGLRTHIS
jgi:hypothetical protein